MDRKIYTDNFEKLLKENADGFNMYPSKKVWHGLYNDLHPGRRWPSVTMFIIFLFSFVVVGHLNTSNNHRDIITAVHAGLAHISLASSSVKKQEYTIFNNADISAGNETGNYNASNVSIASDASAATTAGGSEPLTAKNKRLAKTEDAIAGNIPGKTSVVSADVSYPSAPAKGALQEAATTSGYISMVPKVPVAVNDGNGSNTTFADKLPEVTISNTNNDIASNKITAGKPIASLSNTHKAHSNNNITAISKPSVEVKSNENILQESDASDKSIPILTSTNERDQLTVKAKLPLSTTAAPARKKELPAETTAESKKDVNTDAATASLKTKKHNLAWNYYISPSVSYRHVVAATSPSNSVILNGPVLAQNTDRNPSRQSPSIGMEAGASVNYKIFKRVEFVTGFQMNYARYNIAANNTHPTITSLELNDESSGTPYSIIALSVYGNGTSTSPSAEVTLQNYSFQASLPIGLQYTLFSRDNLKLNLAGTFQPSFIISARSYILSSDKRNYLTDADLLRGWNMNAQFGTYLTFKSNKLNWQVGPQIRYQLLSSFIYNYPGKEHLLDYGIRVGVSKIIK